jgi:hypothetical protein
MGGAGLQANASKPISGINNFFIAKFGLNLGICQPKIRKTNAFLQKF